MTKKQIFLRIILPILIVLALGGATVGVLFGVGVFDAGGWLESPKTSESDKRNAEVDALYEMAKVYDYSNTVVGFSIVRPKVPPQSSIELPSTYFYNGIPYPITQIGYGAFRDHTGLQLVKIPDCVNTIGGSAFSGCFGLVEIDLPQNLKTIGDSAFKGCGKIEEVSLPSNVESIGAYAFSNCSNLKSLTFEQGWKVKAVGKYAFSSTGLSTINFCTTENWSSFRHDSLAFPDKMLTIFVEDSQSVAESYVPNKYKYTIHYDQEIN